MDVKSAFLYGDVKRDIYIELPEQDPMLNKGDYVGKLVKAMYGTRDAPQFWQEVVERKMISLGFNPSKLHPSVYYHPTRKTLVIAHVDYFMCLGREVNLEWLHKELGVIAGI